MESRTNEIVENLSQGCPASESKNEKIRKMLESLESDEVNLDDDNEVENEDKNEKEEIVSDLDVKIIGDLRDTIYTIAQRINALNTLSKNRVRKAKELNEHVDQVIFELIKEDTVRHWKENGESIKKWSGINEAYEKQLQRSLKRTNHYKELHREEYLNYFGQAPEELVVNKTPDGRARFSYSSKLCEYEKLMLEATNKLDILGYLTDRRITEVKKVSNGRLDDDFQKYRDYFSNMNEKTPEQFLLKSFLIQTTEIKYHIEGLYRIASKMSYYNNCKSKDKLPDDFADIATKMIANYIVDHRIFKENSLIFFQFNVIESMNPGNIEVVCNNYIDDVIFSFELKQKVKQRENIMELIGKLTVSQREKYIKKYYNVISIYDEKPVWENKKESNFRTIADKCIKELEVPKIK